MTPEEIKNNITSQVAELKALVNQATDKVAADANANISDLKSQIEGLTAKIASQSTEAQKQLDDVNAQFVRFKNQGAGEKAAKMNIAQLIAKELHSNHKSQLEEFITGRRPFSFDVKEAGNVTFGNSVTGDATGGQYVPGIFGDVRRAARMRTFLPTGTSNSDKIVYVKQTGKNEAPAATLEGNTKPLFDKEITAVEAPVRKIAGHMRVSEEILNDIPALQAFLTTQAVEDLFDAEDTMILYGANNTAPNFTGLTINALGASDIPATVSAANVYNWDAMIAAMAALASKEYTATNIVMNPVDYYTLLMSKTSTNGDYVNNTLVWNGTQAIVGGVPVAVSTAVTAGDLLVGNFQRGAQLFQREGVSVRFYEQDQNNAILNLVTIVIEERLALPIYYNEMFFYDSFANITAAITAS
jgi:HK97 family phage major capsid protein